MRSNSHRLVCAALFLTAAALVSAESTGPQVRFTGGPGDEPLSCATIRCHTDLTGGGPTPVTGSVIGTSVTVAFSSGANYFPGTPVIITVAVSDPSNTSYGFQLSARLEKNKVSGQAGSFIEGAGTFVMCDNRAPRGPLGCPASAPVEFIEHNAPRKGVWSFQWTPPAAGAGTVWFYVAGIAVNNNGRADGGDHVYTNQYFLTEGSPCGRPVITSVNSASDFGSGSNFASGSWLEIRGSGFIVDSTKTRVWAPKDFSGDNAPTSMDTVSVYINGALGYMYYLSPTQINVQAPKDSSVGPTVIAVSTCAATSAPYRMEKAFVAPGLLAPPAFFVDGRQYLVAQFADGTYVGNPDMIPGLKFRQARPGDKIVVYGVGFGEVTTIPTGAAPGVAIPPGVVVRDANSINAPIDFRISTTPVATFDYKGLAPGYIGLYQLNIVVPNVLNSGDLLVTATINGIPATPTPLYMPFTRQ